MKRTVVMTILAMSLFLGASSATKPAGNSGVKELRGLTQQAQMSSEGTKVVNDPAWQQVPILSNEPGKVDREKQPVLVAPGGCHACIHSDFISPWHQLQLFLSMFYL